MARKRKKPFYENVEIVDVGAEGKAIGNIDEKIIFTTLAIPGDVVDLQVTKKRKKFFEARVTRFEKYSENRIKPVCEHFGACGGCKWQMMPYKQQIYFKQKQVEDQLIRIGKLELPPISPILASQKETFYRNKLEFTFSNKRWLTPEEVQSNIEVRQQNSLGFHVPRLYDKVININKCWLQPEPSNQIRNFIYEYAIQNKLNFFDIKEQQGFLRTIIIRTTSTGEVMLIVSFFYEDEKKRVDLLRAIEKQFPEITSLMYVINSKGNDTITDQHVKVFVGKDHIVEKMEELQFKIGPKSFYQTNSEQAYNLYKVARDFANLTGTETVYDLYTGTGTIANFVAQKAKKVVGIEYVPEAIDDAKINSKINQIKNTSFFAGDMSKVLNEEFVAENGKPDVIITDPPRAGMHASVIETMRKIAAQRIVYVSCNPATQARDLALLNDIYDVTKVQPVDMFPQTHHVENVVLLELKNVNSL